MFSIIGSALPWIIKNWRIISLVFGLMALLSAYGIHRHSLIEKGYVECQTEQAQAISDLKEKSRNEIIALQTKYRGIYDRINSSPDNGMVCPISRSAIDSLPEPSSNRK